MTFSAAVDITGSPQLELDFAGTAKAAACTAATNTTTMVCNYRVAVGDVAAGGVAIAANKLTLNGGTITATGSTTVNADLDHGAVLIDANHKVDGIRPTLVTTGSDAPTTSTDGTQVILTFSETLIEADRTKITIGIGGGNVAVTSAARVAGTTVELDLSTIIDATVMLTVALGGVAVLDTASNGNLAVPATPVTNAITANEPPDRAALVALYNATGGATWTDNTNWLSAEALSEWHGVSTDTDGRVTGLILTNNQLTGTIPPELGGLTNLQLLWLQDNQLTGTIPAELGDLTSLQELLLFNNQLTGTIPPELGDLANLISLSLWGNALDGEIPEELGGLTNLQFLFLQDNQLTGTIPAELGDLTSLQLLWLQDNQLTGTIPAELGTLSSLQQLRLDGNELTGTIPTELGDLTSLLWLVLHRNELTGTIPPELGDLTNLQLLLLYNNQLSGTIPPELGGLTSLEWLTLQNNELTGTIPAALGSLTNLQLLYLSSNQLTGEIPPGLGGLTSLQQLWLQDNQLTGTIPPELGGLTNLQQLRLQDNQLTGTIPPELGDLTNLQVLGFWSNELTGMIPAALYVAADRGALEALYNATDGPNWTVGTNWLSAEALSEWHGVSTDEQGRIEELRLSANGLTGMIGAELGVLTRLTGLYLNDNELTGMIPPELENLTQLQVFDIRNTGLCAPSDAAFQAWLATITFQGAVCAPPRPPGGGGGGGGTPRTSVPGAVRNLTAVGGNGEAVLSWDAPSSDGGAEITDYEYRINRSGPWISTGSTETTHTVTGLDNGTTYVFEVRAVNRIGKGRVSNRAEATPEVFTLDFAHFANGALITSDLVFVNVGTHPIRPALYFYDQEGQPIAAESMVEVTGDLEIREDGSLSIQTAMEPLGELTISTHGQGELVSGSVKVVAFGPIGGVLRFDLPGIGVAGVGASPPLSDAIFPVRRQEAGINTGVAIHNLESSPEIVRCELMSGGTVLEAESIPLEANGQSSWFIDAAFPDTDTSGFVGSVHCDAEGPGMFTAVALELDAVNRIFTTLPVLPVRRAGGRAAELNFAHFANGAGLTSDLVFVNLSTERSRPAPTPFHTDILPVRPAIYFYDTEGALVSAESVVDITGDLEVTEDGGVTVQTEMEPLGVLTISTHGRGELVSGSVRVAADEPIGGALRFDLPGIGVAGVGASSPVSDALFPVRRQEGGINTGVAIHNLESSPGLVRCELMREGVLRDAVPIPLAGNGQVSWFIDEMFPATDTSDFVGSVRCTVPDGGSFAGVAVELDAANRIFTTLPVVPVPERMPQE